MKDDDFLELALVFFVLLLFLNYLHVAMFSTLLFLGMLLSAFLFLRGVIEFAIGKGTSHLLMGAALYFMLFILF